MFIDTHCHLEFKQFDADRQAVIQRAREAKVSSIIDVGIDVDTSKQALTLAADNDCVFAALGIHPHYATEITAAAIDNLKSLAKTNKVVAIGEVGLDYYDFKAPNALIDREVRSCQQKVLLCFLELAENLNLPIIFHCRLAADDLLDLLRNNNVPAVRGVVHCFSHDRIFLDRCLDLGLYISFTANITYKKSDTLKKLVRYVPLDRLLLETDAPYLAPQVYRGRRNEPAYIKFLAEEIARLKKIDLEKLATITTQNALKLFKISQIRLVTN